MKWNPGAVIVLIGGLALIYALFGWWVLAVIAVMIPMYLMTNKETEKRRKASAMKREARRNIKNHNTQVLADMWDERHPE